MGSRVPLWFPFASSDVVFDCVMCRDSRSMLICKCSVLVLQWKVCTVRALCSKAPFPLMLNVKEMTCLQVVVPSLWFVKLLKPQVP